MNNKIFFDYSKYAKQASLSMTNYLGEVQEMQLHYNNKINGRGKGLFIAQVIVSSVLICLIITPFILVFVEGVDVVPLWDNILLLTIVLLLMVLVLITSISELKNYGRVISFIEDLDITYSSIDNKEKKLHSSNIRSLPDIEEYKIHPSIINSNRKKNNTIAHVDLSENRVLEIIKSILYFVCAGWFIITTVLYFIYTSPDWTDSFWIILLYILIWIPTVFAADIFIIIGSRLIWGCTDNRVNAWTSISLIIVPIVVFFTYLFEVVW